MVTLTVDDFFSMLDKKLGEKLSEALPKPDAENLPEYLSRKEVAEYLGVCLATVDNYSRLGVLEKRFVGSVPRFHRDEVRKVLHDLKK